LDPSNIAFAYAHCAECYRLDVRQGELTCGSGHRFGILKSVPRFNPEQSEQKRTKTTFDMEWSGFRYGERIYGHSEEEELQDFFRRMSVDISFLQGKTVLDAGCGTGRLTRSIARCAKEVVGMDFSGGIEEASHRNRALTNVHIVQGDIMHPPFKEASFDYVYSKGVLHYVPDVWTSLRSLASLVGRGGYLSVTINPERSFGFEFFNKELRRITVKLPLAAVYWLSHSLVPFLDLAWFWSGLERRPIEWKERAHMIFNWLSSEHLNTSSDREMTRWFTDLGFDGLELSEIPVGVRGSKS
jgi:ubiquinone/menaquinone biosynthesis C-methylase UbiE